MEKNVIFGNNDNLLGYAEDVLKYLESLVQQNENERVNIAKTCGNVDNEYYDNTTRLYNEAINDLKTKEPMQFVEVWYHPMGAYVVHDLTLIDNETKEEIL